MRIEIFVITTELKNGFPENAEKWSQLEDIKMEIIHEFGGLTESEEEKGYWSSNGSICVDSVKRWLIYANDNYSIVKIEDFAKNIKAITAQKSQVFAINETLHFI